MCCPAIWTSCPVPCRAPAVRGPVARDSLHNSTAELTGRPAGSVPPWGLLSDELIGPIGHSGAVYGSLRAWDRTFEWIGSRLEGYQCSGAGREG